ncbi:MAG TPA: DUF1800 domain-containing protein [Casimicrobiaceae bacterium]|nr:DUF1800 domain-containing protein [Casimicrobiaceae bacterium]
MTFASKGNTGAEEPAAPCFTARGIARCSLAVALSALFSLVASSSEAASLLDRADATRLLEQSSFGPTDALVAHVQAIGVQGWLAEQFAATGSRYPTFPAVPIDATTYCATSPDAQCLRNNYSLFLLRNAFFQNALANPDQLRQRVAFALSQIFVTSGVVVPQVYGMAQYQQILLDGAFGNFEDLMTKVTLSPVMGDYLNMVNNDKPAGAVNPNENYARELMQLFSIGLWELNADGTQLLDSAGFPIPTYEQDTVEGFAHVYTGWTYPLPSGAVQHMHNPKNFNGPMVGVPSNHDTGAKELLGEVTDSAGKPMNVDLAFAIHNIFTHPNVGPFIGRQLIQKLVTSNPSPAFVARVAAVFADNGAGVRGDLKAIVAAILTDPEARGDTQSAAAYGKVREPVLLVTAIARAAGAASDGVYLASSAENMGENLFNAPSVFNYYPPNYMPTGLSVQAPEFALRNAATTISLYNFGNTFVFGSIPPLATLPGAIGTQPNWTPWQALAANPAALIAELNALFFHGTMPAAMQTTLATAVGAVPASDTLTRAKTAFYLVVTSPQYQVER